jgi:uncharacterized protein YceK
MRKLMIPAAAALLLGGCSTLFGEEAQRHW